MESESEIFKESNADNIIVLPTTSCLIRTGRLFSYYRLQHDGKYFFFKTFTEDTKLARKLLRKEYDLGASCDSPYLPHFFLYGEYVKGKEGILMEYIDGRSLTDFMTEKPLLRERNKVFSQLLEAVRYLHKKGITHNDIKPDNLLITNNGNNLKLIDFGLSDNDAHFLLKTPGCSAIYAAPELLSHRKTDARSDIYSIGVIMTVLYGRRHRRIAGKCKRSNPATRYPDMTALNKAWRKRNRSMKTAIGILIAFLLFIGVGMEVLDRRETRGRTHELEAALQEEKAAFANLKTSYNALTDSIESERIATERHEKAKQERIENFNNGLKELMAKTEKKLSNTSDLSDFVVIYQQYMKDVGSYFENFDKIVDEEDLTATLNLFMIRSFSESDKRFDAIRLKRQKKTLGAKLDII